ncbi:MAG TPA: chorismate mutase, partial [Longimicrobiales bacterium]|nr:chorismate mutase [Longimicrobiales bacterium]
MSGRDTRAGDGRSKADDAPAAREQRSDGGDAAWLTELRTEIEAIDRSIVERLATRAELARAAGRAKRQAGLPTLDPRREAAVVR